MKKVLLILFLISIWNIGFSQETYKKNIIGVGMAASLAVQRIQYQSPDGYYILLDHTLTTTKITPVFAFSYDYRVNSSLSIGGALGYQLVEMSNNYLQEYKFISLERYNVSMRLLYFYKEYERFRLYSGLRLGININSIMAKAVDPSWAENFETMNGIQYAPQLIGIGAQFNMTPDILIVGEICIGTPYVLYFGMAVNL